MMSFPNERARHAAERCERIDDAEVFPRRKAATSYRVEGLFDGVTFYWGERGWSDDARDALHHNYAGAVAAAAGKSWTDGDVTRRPEIKPC